MRLKEVRPPAEKKARVRALLLLSGGLDSILAGKILEEQGIEIVGLSFSSLFFGAREAIRAAEEQNWPLVIADITEEEIRIVENPRYGYGRNMNPCIDCHGQMVRIAGQLLERYQADFVATGEVLGERPKSQNRQALEIVEKLGQLKGLVLRPLSARLLPVTRVEEQGLVDREKLLDISGRSRKRQLELAVKYGIKEYPTPAGGCLLTDPGFSQRLKNLLSWRGRLLAEDISLIKIGRIFFEGEAFFVIGRNEQENEKLKKRILPGDVVISLSEQVGPLTVLRLKQYGLSEGENEANRKRDEAEERLHSRRAGKFVEKENGMNIQEPEGSSELRHQAESLDSKNLRVENSVNPQLAEPLDMARIAPVICMESIDSILSLPAVRKAALLTVRYSRARCAERASVVVSFNKKKEILEFKREDWASYM